jgi:DNA-binding NarL/FixJ family response regulator
MQDPRVVDVGLRAVRGNDAPMAAPIRVVLVEDNEVFREALELLLGLRNDVAVVGSVGDGGEAVRACVELGPDVVLMDYRLPGMDGVQATTAIRAAAPAVAVIVLTAEVSPRERDALKAAGAVSCLTKDDHLDEIVAAIQRAAGRERGQ